MTMTNAEWCIKNGYKFKNIHIEQSNTDFCIYEIWIGNVLLINTYRCTNERTDSEIILKWLDQEHKEPILDDAEKRYLSAVIRPFRDKVISIKKSSGLYASHYFDEISVYYESFGHDLCFDLPPFEKGTMYKGMKKDHDYTLEELGL